MIYPDYTSPFRCKDINSTIDQHGNQMYLANRCTVREIFVLISVGDINYREECLTDYTYNILGNMSSVIYVCTES